MDLVTALSPPDRSSATAEDERRTGPRAERLEDAGGGLRWDDTDGWFTLDARVPAAPGPA